MGCWDLDLKGLLASRWYKDCLGTRKSMVPPRKLRKAKSMKCYHPWQGHALDSFLLRGLETIKSWHVSRCMLWGVSLVVTSTDMRLASMFVSFPCLDRPCRPTRQEEEKRGTKPSPQPWSGASRGTIESINEHHLKFLLVMLLFLVDALTSSLSRQRWTGRSRL
jgi:hypothetical protein